MSVRVMVSPEAEALWRRARALSGEEAGIAFERAVEQYVARLEAQKFKTTDRPRSIPTDDAAPGHRRIAAAVKRAVTARDGHRCTFVSDDGLRCGETDRLEFDHVVPVAQGGRSIVDNLRLRCRAHNQLEAERVFGRGFMERKRGTLPGQGDASSRRGARAGVGCSAERRGSDGIVLATLPGQSDSRSRAAERTRPAGIGAAEEARRALRALDFSAHEAFVLLDAARATTETQAPAEAWVSAALRAHRRGALERAPRPRTIESTPATLP